MLEENIPDFQPSNYPRLAMVGVFDFPEPRPFLSYGRDGISGIVKAVGKFESKRDQECESQQQEWKHG